MREKKELKIQAADQSLQTVNAFIHSLLPSSCDELLLDQIDLAVEEVFVNISHYSGAEEVTIVCCFEDEGEGLLEVTFIDEGKPFNPLDRADPDITLSAEERKIGGLGIFLTKKFMDSVEYEFSEGKNNLKLIKTLSGQ